VITMRDLRELGYCAIGARRVCRASGLDFRKLIKGGLTLEEIQIKAPERYSKEITETYGERENG